MKHSWHGLLFTFRTVACGGGPGYPPDFQIAIEEVAVEDEAEFREYHPTGSPKEIDEQHADEIDDYLYKAVTDGSCSE
jgi:hypothetical protein